MDKGPKFVPGFFRILYLGFHEVVALADLLVLLNGGEIHGAEGLYLAAQFVEAALGLLGLGYLLSQLLGHAVCNFVFVPELADYAVVVLLHVVEARPGFGKLDGGLLPAGDGVLLGGALPGGGGLEVLTLGKEGVYLLLGAL